MVLVATRRHAGKAHVVGLTNSKRWSAKAARSGPPAIVDAVLDALAPFDIDNLDVPALRRVVASPFPPASRHFSAMELST